MDNDKIILDKGIVKVVDKKGIALVPREQLIDALKILTAAKRKLEALLK